ncbi:MAG: hypothetical protein EOO10_17080 [Chitinophagaceae bacterium]|nr:MAG: hypothetical protein EOO10_17080 [Chitinophagaceae bacterium]
METFSLDISKEKQQRLKAYLFNIGIFLIPILYDVAVDDSFLKDSYYYFVCSFLFVNLIKEVFAERTFRVSFDTQSHRIMLSSKPTFSRQRAKAIPFNQARLEYTDEGSFLFFKGAIKLCFMDNKMEVGCIKESTRGFTKETMKEIIKKAQDINIPVTVNE